MAEIRRSWDRSRNEQNWKRGQRRRKDPNGHGMESSPEESKGKGTALRGREVNSRGMAMNGKSGDELTRNGMAATRKDWRRH